MTASSSSSSIARSGDAVRLFVFLLPVALASSPNDEKTNSVPAVSCPLGHLRSTNVPSEMTTLVHAALTVRRSARAAAGYIVALVFTALSLAGVFGRPGPSVEHAIVAIAWIGVFALRVSTRARAPRTATLHLDIELGLLALSATHAVIQLAGGLDSPFYPMIFVVVGLFAALTQTTAVGVLLAFGIVLDAALWFGTEGRRDITPFATRLLFLVFFGLTNTAFTRVELQRVRRSSKRELDREKAKVKDDARLFRLASAPSSTTASDEERLFRSSLQEVHDSLFHVLDLLKQTLELHTCVLLLMDEGRERLRIVELATDSQDIADGPFPSAEGAVGAVASRRLVMNLEHLRPGYRGLCYYQHGAVVQSFVGIPIVEAGLVGALCADRLDDRPFGSREETILREAVHQILRTLENERLFVQLERQKREQTILYQASQKLGAAHTEEEVLSAGLSAAAEIAPFDFAAVTTFDPEEKRHLIRKAVGEGSENFTGLGFRDNTSLTAMAVKNRHYLPYRGDFDPMQQVVFTKRAKLHGMQSLLVMPLVAREDAIGTIGLAAKRAHAFGDGVRPTLQLLANHVGVALSNAEAVRRLEEMATTDGLTGCLNKRAFLSELDQKLRSAARFGRPLSLVVIDIDHFKTVNDTYGHASGDDVLRGLGAVLRREKRDTDSVARFGGEEFCLLCEETDTQGATLLAERVREELAAQEFSTSLGSLKVTASAGVATFPSDAGSDKALFEAADQALYAAKNSGRNRVCTRAASR